MRPSLPWAVCGLLLVNISQAVHANDAPLRCIQEVKKAAASVVDFPKDLNRQDLIALCSGTSVPRGPLRCLRRAHQEDLFKELLHHPRIREVYRDQKTVEISLCSGADSDFPTRCFELLRDMELATRTESGFGTTPVGSGGFEWLQLCKKAKSDAVIECAQKAKDAGIGLNPEASFADIANLCSGVDD